jgi:hypothetical protein
MISTQRSESPNTDCYTSSAQEEDVVDSDQASQDSFLTGIINQQQHHPQQFRGLLDQNEQQLEQQQHLDQSIGKSLAFRVLVDIFEDSKEPRACVVHIFATNTVEDFKCALEKLEGIPVSRQRVVFSGQQLENARHMTFDPNASASSVGDGYQIRPGDTCTLVVLTSTQAAAAAALASVSLTATASSLSSSMKNNRGKSAARNRRGPERTKVQRHTRLKGQSSSPSSSSLKKLVGHTHTRLRLRVKPTVSEIRAGSLTPVWASTRRVTKPSKKFRPTHYHPFGEKSEDTFMKSTMVNGGLHPYLFDRQKKIPQILQQKQHRRPQTAHNTSSTVPLARSLGLPESDVEWEMALTHQFKTLYFQLNEKNRSRVLNDLIVHSSHQNVHAAAATSNNSSRSNGASSNSRLRATIDDHLANEPLPRPSSSNKLNMSSRGGGGGGSSGHRRMKMSERAELRDRIYQLQRLSSTQKDELTALHEKYTTLKETSRSHIAATKVQLKQTQMELRERIQREIEGALLNPEEAKNMLDERSAFQRQIDELEQQVNALRQHVQERKEVRKEVRKEDDKNTDDPPRTDTRHSASRNIAHPNTEQKRIEEKKETPRGNSRDSRDPKDNNKHEHHPDHPDHRDDARHNHRGHHGHRNHRDGQDDNGDHHDRHNRHDRSRSSNRNRHHISQQQQQQHSSPHQESREHQQQSRSTPPSLPSTSRENTPDGPLSRSRSHPDLSASSEPLHSSTGNARPHSESSDESSRRSTSQRNTPRRSNGNTEVEHQEPRSESNADNIADQMVRLRNHVKKEMDNVIPRILQSASSLENVDPYGEDFMAWARSVVSNGSRTDEQMSRQGRHLLKAVATLGRCDGLSSRSVCISLKTLHVLTTSIIYPHIIYTAAANLQ